MKALPGFLQCKFRVCCIAACLAATAVAAQAQTGIPVFSSVDVRRSTAGTSVHDLNTFGTAPLNLTCPDSTKITGILSSTPDGKSNLLVDNYISLTANGTTTNLCYPIGNGIGPNGNPGSCFNSNYSANIVAGQHVDGAIAATGGVPPIDVSKYLVAGSNAVTFDLVDFGGYLSSSSIYLNTNCTPNGASGNGKVTGNPISSANPTPAELTQNFSFSSSPNLIVQLLFDLSAAFDAGTLNTTNGSTPTVADQAIDPTIFPEYVAGTSFATSQCLIHNGELLNGSPACKLYTLTCQIGQGSHGSGVQCPSSSARNIVIQDDFDFPPLSLPDITYNNNGVTEVFHQGFGLLEASEGWTGGPCTFDPGADQLFSCPENLLTLFTGPGRGRGTGTPQPGLNSSFISVGPVPEWRTHLDLVPWSANHVWVNSHNVTGKFITTAPQLPPGFNGGDLNGFKAAPLYGITYGVAPLNSQPSTEFPVAGDITLPYPGGCPTPGTPAPEYYRPAPVQIQVSADGKYLVHFFATDCAGTEELYFQQDNSGSWGTSFYTAIMFVDTVAPKVIAGPVLSPAPSGQGYQLGQQVYATFQCSDDFSGVAKCAAHSYSNPVKEPPSIKALVDTSTPGSHTYTVNVLDVAGNAGTPASVTYSVQ